MIEIFKDKKKQYRFRVKARNGKIIAQSEGYKQRKSCEGGIKSLISNIVGDYNTKRSMIKDCTGGK